MTDRAGYAEISGGPGGTVRVELDRNHPGVADAGYRRRRDAIAALAVNWRPGWPLPLVDYQPQETETWSTVSAGLGPLWRRRAARRIVDAVETLGLPTGHVPQLSEVTTRLVPKTGFRYQPVAGLAPLRSFYEAFAEGVFWSTQYLRHHSHPLYTPEPDVCHEVLGHAHHLADPAIAGLYRAVGAAAGRVDSDDALVFLSRVFWHTLEFGVVIEEGELKAYGAGLLSSVGELQAFRHATIRPLDWTAMGTSTYDITRYQTVLYCAPSMPALIDEMACWLDGYDDNVSSRALYRRQRLA
jgi:phenylalanine-4-hydroxylase